MLLKTKRKSPVKENRIIADLRREIVRGDWVPGDCLPTRQELSSRFDVSIMTVQRAVDRLVADRYLRATAGRGTYVADHPPHLSAYAVVFQRRSHQTHFFLAQRRAAEIVFSSESRRLCLYESEINNPQDPKNLRLVDDVVNHRIAGVILVWPAGEFISSALFAPGCDVPCVALSGLIGGTPSLTLDAAAFFERAVDRLLSLGRRRIAHIGVGDDHRNDIDHLTPILRHRGLEHRPYWDQGIGATYFTAARRAAHGLMSLAPTDRPDGLIISDDNLVEHVQAGLADAGTCIPSDLQIVAHCNWPEPPAAIFPLIRLGFDAVDLMHTCTRLIDQQRRGVVVPQVVNFRPLFEEELHTSAGLPAVV